MKTLTKRILLATAAAGVLGTTAAAWAFAGERGSCHESRQGPRAEQMQERHASRHAQHQADLKAALKLTPEQEEAWKTFTAAMQPDHQSMAHPDPAEWAQLTTPQRMEKMQALQAERQARMGERLAAVQQFYKALTPEQQKVFDTQHQGKHQRGGDHQSRHGHHHG